MIKKFSAPFTSGNQGIKIWPFLFNIISLQGNAFSPSLFELSYRFKIEGLFLATRLLPLWLLHCFHTVYHEDGSSVLGTDRSRQEHYQENVGDEEGFQIHIQSQQSLQLVTCGQGRCRARAEHRASVFLASFLRFPGVYASIRLHNMHRLSCYLAQDNQSWSPLDYPKKSEALTFPAEPS